VKAFVRPNCDVAHAPRAAAGTRRAAARSSLQRCARRAAPAVLLPHHRPVETLETRTLLSVSTDNQGFTVVTPSADSRVIHVAANGSDGNNGLSPAAPVATLAHARTLVRSGFPDWIVIRRGDTFNGQRFGSWNLSGRSSSEPFVIGAYTDPAAPSTARPKLNTGINTGISFSGSGASHVYIMGLEFEAHRRDYRDPPSNFTSDWLTDAQGGTYGINGSVPVSDILVEDSYFRYYRTGLVFQNNPTNIRVRRNVIADSWAVNIDQFGNAMGFDTAANGIYADNVNGLAIDQNVLWHNGWADSNALGARQNLYSHNLYLNTGNSNVSVTNNVIADAASHGLQMRAGGLVTGNLFLRNPIAMSYGLVNGAVKAGGVSGEISDNVVVGSAAIFDQARGWGIEIANLKSIADGGGTVIRNNVFANDSQNTNPAIKLDQPSTSVPDVGINDLLIEQNIVYAWWKGLSVHPSYDVSRPLNGLVVRQNDFQRINSTSTIIDFSGPFVADSQAWSNNRYDSLSSDPGALLFKIGGVNRTLAQWQSIAEPTAVRALGIFPEPGRTAGGYNQSIGGVNSTDAFIAQAMRQGRSFWRTAFTTAPVNDWIRAGYAGGRIDRAAPTASGTAANITIGGDAVHTITVTYADDNQLNLASLGDGDLRVSGPNGYSAAAALVGSTGPADGRQRTATYRITAPEGEWSAAANGLYTLAVDPGQVLDASGKSASTDVIGSFSVAIDPAVPAAVATSAAVITDTAPATVSVTYTGAISPPLAISVAPANSGFETPSVAGEAGGFLYAPAGGGWTFNDSAGIAADNSAFTADNGPAPQGGQVAFLQMSGAMSQTIADWQAGTYSISVSAAQRGLSGSPAHEFQVLVDGQVVGTIAPADNVYRRYVTPTFTVAAGSHTVELRGLSPNGDDLTSLIDDVQISGQTAASVQQFNPAAFDAGDIRLAGAGGYSGVPTAATVDQPVEGRSRTVTYTVPAPAGGWSSLGAAALDVRMVSGQVTTTGGTEVPAGKVGTLPLSVELPFVAAVSAADVVAASTANQTFTVSYADNAPGDALASSVDSLDLRVTGPGGYSQAATLVGKTGSGTTGSPVVATYTVTAPAGGWSSTINGTYWINAQQGQVVDADGNALPAGAIGSFAVAVDSTAPLAWASEDPISGPATGSKFIGVSYYDISSINPATIDAGDVRVVGPNGFDSGVSLGFNTSDRTASYAEYLLAAPGGKWQSRHNGVYSVVLQPNQVADKVGNAVTTATTIAQFTVALETTPPTATIATPTPNPRNAAVASIGIAFSETVTGVDLADFDLKRNGVGVPLSGASVSSADGRNYTITGLSGLTGGAGGYVLTLNAAGSGIQDAAGNAMAASANTAWTTDLTAPTVSIAAITPDPRTTPVDSAAINFSETVNGFDVGDLSLTRDGTVVPLTGVSLTSSNGTAYTLSGLSAATAAAGRYVLTLNVAGAGITDAAGNAPASGATTAWTNVAPVTIVSWASALVHERGVGEAALTVPDDGTFTEPRSGGVRTLLVNFSGAIDPASLTPAGVGIWGNDINSAPINLGGISVSTATRAGNTVAAISFSTPLPDASRYLVRLTGVRSAAGFAVTGDNDRVLTALAGDINGDSRTNNTDVGSAISGRGVDPINPLSAAEVRADVNMDGRTNNTDLGATISYRGTDARFIANPVAMQTAAFVSANLTGEDQSVSALVTDAGDAW